MDSDLVEHAKVRANQTQDIQELRMAHETCVGLRGISKNLIS
jgi:hypothetical protein